MNWLDTVALVLLGSLCLAGCQGSGRTATVEEHAEAIATVRAVAPELGLLAFESASGERGVVQVGPDVKNLSEIDPGDRLRIRYSRAVAAHVVKAEAPQVLQHVEKQERTLEPGKRPELTSARETKALVRVEEIDTAANTVIVTGPDGLQRMFNVRTPQMRRYIRTLKAGDTVEVTFTEAVAVSIEPLDETTPPHTNAVRFRSDVETPLR